MGNIFKEINYLLVIRKILIFVPKGNAGIIGQWEIDGM